MQDNLESFMLEKYKALYHDATAPIWAVQNKKTEQTIRPSIPFIGRNYASSAIKIAVYASAENLTYYEKSSGDNTFLETENAWNRHRYAFELWRQGEKRTFFPKVHIAPVENGGLLCATLFLFKLLGEKWSGSPQDLLEAIVVANVGKYSISTVLMQRRHNFDYAGDFDKLEYSVPFFRTDLEILKPKVLLLPYRIYSHAQIKQLVNEIIPDTLVMPVYQCNARILNTHLKKFSEQATMLKNEIVNYFPLLVDWTNKMNKGLQRNIYRYYFHVQSIFDGYTN